MRMSSILAAVAASAVLLTACANQKEPAEQAVAKIEATFNDLKADAGKYAAEELKDVEKAVARLKKKVADQDYGDALQSAPAVASTVSKLKDTVTARKAEADEMLAAFQAEWTELSTSVPQLVSDVQSRVDSLSRSRRLPRGMDKDAFEKAKADFEAVKTSWAQATTEFGSGMAADAVRKARAAKAKSQMLLNRLSA
jgi:PBP1b-binding outer membrane lipoprotein LpoB